MKTNIKKMSIDGLFVHNLLSELINGCSAVQGAGSLGQYSIIPQELYDYVYDLIDKDELKIVHGWLMNVHNSVGFRYERESYDFTYEGEVEPFGTELIHHFCMVECSYTVFEDGFFKDFKFTKGNEKTYNLYIPWYDVQIEQNVNNAGLQSIRMNVNTTAFAKAMPVNEYSKLMEMMSKYCFIPQLTIRFKCFNKSGIEKIEKKMLELALKKYNEKPE